MHRVVSRDQWIAERRQLMQEEKEFTRRRDALGEKRRALPWVKVDKRYEFDAPEGRVTLSDLFRGRSQIFMQHIMQGPGQPLQCVGCALGIDHLEGILPHLENHDVSCIAVARATLPEIEALRKKVAALYGVRERNLLLARGSSREASSSSRESSWVFGVTA